jgi:hypothetical protein
MPKYNLLCRNDHEFEGWFQTEKSYLDQKKKKMIACPTCDDTGIRRAVMAPNIGSKSNKKKNTAFFNGRTAVKHLRSWIQQNCENVGDRFANECRKAEAGERDDHIYGTATDKEIKDLQKEGIGVIGVPDVKDN